MRVRGSLLLIAVLVMAAGFIVCSDESDVASVSDAANKTLEIQHAYYQEQMHEGKELYAVTVDFNTNPNEYCVTAVVNDADGDMLVSTYVENVGGTRLSISLPAQVSNGATVSFIGDETNISALVKCKVNFYDGSVLKDTGYPGIGETISYRLTDDSKSFKGWAVIEGSEETVKSVSKSTSLYAVWYETVIDRSITVNNDGHGTAGANPSSAKSGTEVTLYYKPDVGYVFDGWETTSDIVIKDNKFTMIDDDVSIEASFRAVETYALVECGSSCWHGAGEVDVQISLTSNPGVSSLKFFVSYDKSVMHLESAESSGLMKMTRDGLSKDEVGFYFKSAKADKGVYDTGVLVTLTFSVVKGTADGSYTVQTRAGDAVADDLSIRYLCASDGSIVVQRIPGDVNGDGSVDISDSLFLRRYIAGRETETPGDADVDNDGDIDGSDSLLLRKHLARWNVELS